MRAFILLFMALFLVNCGGPEPRTPLKSTIKLHTIIIHQDSLNLKPEIQ